MDDHDATRTSWAAQRSVAAAMPASAPPPYTCRRSPSEQDTLPLLVAGRSNAEFAKTLHISEATVKAHVNRLLVEPDVNNRVQLAVLAFAQV
ncbi:response regulator transcription factor [Streptomyces umbrinus]|uniref:response regulator transcription factor n=1 Tax=Streptomyces umbrinus TaxID=67370 RepID=UPI003C2F55BD